MAITARESLGRGLVGAIISLLGAALAPLVRRGESVVDTP